MTRHAVCVVGASGRMGSRVLHKLERHPELRLASALVAPSDEKPETKALVTTDPEQAFAAAAVVIDFSAPAACATLLAAAKIPYLVASTGLADAEQQAIAVASKRIAVLQAANLSLGVNVMLELVELAARRLGGGVDVEIAEIHHKLKKDAPSGTALALAEATRAGRPGLKDVYGRRGAREVGELGLSASRGGDAAGEHTVFFFGSGERLELTHRATTPDIFADGALFAARWLVGRTPGRYRMRDVLL